MSEQGASNAADPVDTAIGWHLRLSSATRDEWAAFVTWLEASPDHAAAYDRVTLDDALVAPMLDEAVAPARIAANDTANDTNAHDAAFAADRRPWFGRRLALWGGPAIAAVLTAAILLPGGANPSVEVRTAPGIRKLVAFADGSRITVNGDSRLRLERGNMRFAALEAGEATFEIRHDAARPFIVKSGALTLHDLGTTFNVVRDGHRLGLEVSEGAVLFEPERQALTVRPGIALDVDEAARRVEFSRVAPADVGAWRYGRLAFGADRLSDVAAAVGRATGLKVTVAPELADIPFTGSLTLDRDRPATIERLARLTGNRARRTGTEWKIVPVGHASD